MFKYCALLVLMFTLMILLAYRLDTHAARPAPCDEMMYFPSGYGLQRVSFGHCAVLADAVWIWFVQYYGKHRLTDRKYDHMYHILDILTTYNPAFLKAYQLGSMLLTHDAQRPDQAKALLKKGMIRNPDAWTLPFYYGFLHFVFLGDYETAQVFFRFAARKPGAPDMPKRWEAYVTYKKKGDLDTALELWLDLYNNTTNPEEKRVAELYIKDIQMQKAIRTLSEQIERFMDCHGRAPVSLEELVEYGFLESIPEEPHGGYFVIRNGKVEAVYENEWQLPEPEY
ncbi:hypothetical protein JXB22_04540 [candidate division WOR-3 bacterium]|nr:hypothetical protein [candidate division WOR-3 bacterium]